ncbi:ThiF family adenylyltransferase [Candidatus Woesearchaeota archaeon]|nr:ThiF family adenylyltransferase [Candidatus Woesearchaeota archaeon]
MTTAAEIDTARLHRLMLGIGADGYEKLKKSQVSVVFDSEVGKYVALPLAASGIPLVLVSASQKHVWEQLIDIPLQQAEMAHSYAGALRQFNGNPSLETIIGVEAAMGFHGSTALLGGSSVVIDCTNSQLSKEACLSFARKAKASFISISVVPGYARLELAAPDNRKVGTSVLMPGMAEMEAGLAATIRGNPLHEAGASITKEMMGMFMGGMAADETVRLILGKGQPLNRPLYLKFGYGSDVFSPKQEHDELRYVVPGMFGSKSALLFGLGAVGANVAFWLSKIGMGRVDTLDYDVVEITNVMRTLFYHQHVGELKAEVASQKIKALSCGSTESKSFNVKLAPGWEPGQDYSIYVDGFDNFLARSLVHRLGIQNKTPVLSASGRFDGFDMETYVPGQTLCFDCNFGLGRLAEKEEADRRNSCVVEFTPQNTWVNQSVGALAAMLIVNVFNPDRYGSVPNGMVMYDPSQESRLFVNSKAGSCAFSGGEMQHGI